jgi:hypothetical protein
LTKPLPNQCRVFPETHVRRRRQQYSQPKRKRSNSEADVHPHHHQQQQQQNNKNIKGENDHDGEDDLNSRNCTICLRYNSMLYLDFLDEPQDNNAHTTASISSEMLVVEQPWLDVVATFPEALHRRVYGFN